MSVWRKALDHSSIREIRDNPRLQWMLVAIGLILMVSITKSISDGLQHNIDQLEQQKGLYSRVLSAANQSIDQNLVSELETQYQQAFASLPAVSSDNVAQAEALKRMEQIISNKITKSRVNLIAVETISMANKTVWQVRLDVAGQLAEQDFISVIQNISGDHTDIRLLSMQYNPKLSNTISLVVDFLFIAEPNNAS